MQHIPILCKYIICDVCCDSNLQLVSILYLFFQGGAVNFGTWHSAIYGFANAKELVALRKENKKEPLPKYTPKLSKR